MLPDANWLPACIDLLLGGPGVIQLSPRDRSWLQILSVQASNVLRRELANICMGICLCRLPFFRKKGGRCQPGGMQRYVRDWVIVFIQYIYLRVGVMPSYWNIPDRCLQTLPDASWFPAGVFNKMTWLIYGFWSAGVGVTDLFTHMLNLFVSGSILT